MPDMSKCFSHHTNRENPLTRRRRGASPPPPQSLGGCVGVWSGRNAVMCKNTQNVWNVQTKRLKILYFFYLGSANLRQVFDNQEINMKNMAHPTNA